MPYLCNLRAQLLCAQLLCAQLLCAQLLCAQLLLAAVTILFAKDVLVKKSCEFQTEEVCKWLKKEGVDTTGVADISGKVQLFVRRSS